MTLPLTPRMGGSPYASSTNALETFTGWTEFDTTVTYLSADAPSYRIQAPVSLSGYVSPGMRVRLKQGGGYQYFLVTKLDNTGDYVHITMYGGTDYTLANAAITDLAFSPLKAPYGFNPDPEKWTVQFTTASTFSQSSPTVDIWYDTGFYLDVPIGSWLISYDTVIGSGGSQIKSTLSTTTNSETYQVLSDGFYVFGASIIVKDAYATNHILLNSKTSYYLLLLTTNASTSIKILDTTIIRAVSAYL